MIHRCTSPSILTLTALVIAIGCGGDSKPGATAPNGSSDKPDAPAQADKGADGEQRGVSGVVDAAKTENTDKVKVVDGAPASDDNRFALHVDTPEAQAGKPGQVMVRVVPKEPWHMNLDFPTSLKVDAPAGVALAKADLKMADAKKLDENACEFAVDFTPSTAGEQSFTGKIKFAVCQDDLCAPVTKDLEFKVAVK